MRAASVESLDDFRYGLQSRSTSAALAEVTGR